MGVFRAAQGGVVFLDEIGEMPLDLQPKLLRVLQQREVTPVGASRPVKIDVQVVAATNRNLESEVAQERFREDLYYRLNMVVSCVPPRCAIGWKIFPSSSISSRSVSLAAMAVPCGAPDHEMLQTVLRIPMAG